MKVPPLLQLLIAAVIMLIIAMLTPYGSLGFAWGQHLSIVVAVIGLMFVLAGGIVFIQAGTTVNPISPEKSSTLVTNGIYAVTRNPMYLGFIVVLLAWGLYLDSAVSFIMLPAFYWYITKSQILFEEQVLEKKFGDSYRVYCTQVRRWI